MTTTTPQAPETDSKENGLLNAYKTKEEIEKLYLDSSSLDEKIQKSAQKCIAYLSENIIELEEILHIINIYHI
jgi:hypothetical protein